MLWLKNNLRYLFLLVLFGVAALVWYAVFAESRDGLLVAFLDVGQGDAILTEWTQYTHSYSKLSSLI